MEQVQKPTAEKEFLETMQTALAYIALRSQSAATGVYGKKRMCEMFKEFEIELGAYCKAIESIKEVI